MGLNVAIREDEFPPELRETAISLLPTEAEGGLPPSGAPGVRRALAALNEMLGVWLEAGDEQILDAYRARDALSGRQISWEGGSGVAEMIDERGHLVVETTGRRARDARRGRGAPRRGELGQPEGERITAVAVAVATRSPFASRSSPARKAMSRPRRTICAVPRSLPGFAGFRN